MTTAIIPCYEWRIRYWKSSKLTSKIEWQSQKHWWRVLKSERKGVRKTFARTRIYKLHVREYSQLLVLISRCGFQSCCRSESTWAPIETRVSACACFSSWTRGSASSKCWGRLQILELFRPTRHFWIGMRQKRLQTALSERISMLMTKTSSHCHPRKIERSF